METILKTTGLRFALLAAAALPLPAWCSDIGPPISWRASLAAELNETPDLAKITETLIVKYDPESEIVRPTVGEATFVDLDADGILELVALVDYSGRLFFNTITVITTRAGHPVVTRYRSNGTNMDGLDERVITAPGSTKKFLVADRLINRYEGSIAGPKEQRVLELKSGSLEDVSKQHRDYYLAARLPALEKRAGLAGIESTGNSSKSSSTSAIERDEKVVLRQELERAQKQSLGE
jgi:hypothetical protein